MAKGNSYNCILYNIGDKVMEKHGSTEILEIEATDLRYVGIFPCLFLKFKDKPEDIGNFSNLYMPAGESIEKYKDGLKYFNEVKVLKQKEQSVKGSRVLSGFTRRVKQDNTLTAEDLAPVRVPKGTFTSGTPLKEKNE